MATIKDIANKAGVSRGTVDRALNNRAGVNPEIAKKIKKIAQELNYTKNKAGSLLAIKKKNIKIGCLLPDIGNHFFDRVKIGIKSATKEFQDYGLSIHIEHVQGFQLDCHMRALEKLEKGSYDALLLTTINTKVIENKIKTFQKKGIAVACINTDVPNSNRLFYVGPDYYKSGVATAGLIRLINKPSNNILIVTGSLSVKGHNDRIKGFIDTLNKNKTNYNIIDIVESNDSEKVGYSVVESALKKYDSINTVYFVAAGVEGGCKAIIDNTLVKNRPKIFCYDLVPATISLLEKGIIESTVIHNAYDQGYKAIELMFNNLVFNNDSTKPKDYIIKPEIHIKEII
ncbi:MAG: LacI family DNA-binding transcriptional regulator [Sphaerochaetaceae bacterium]|nr:LacI family DNA-binding transcriptional regulator [Sphaerochaetaceae bacterium]MDC7242983.1 LacI family DNA-binding transcriptional regulator [Sphaerochaetaceae bacterium]MDC7248594.1 LacI family DNA-binding transcriptional regulator [Sphaerochaetaceae bacterium]